MSSRDFIWILDSTAAANAETTSSLAEAGWLARVFEDPQALQNVTRNLAVPLPTIFVIDAALVDRAFTYGPAASARVALLRQIPILLVTQADITPSKPSGHAHGLTMHIAKPYSANDLTAAVKRLAEAAQAEWSSRARLKLDIAALSVATPERGPVTLTPREYQILLALYKSEAYTVARRDLFESVWSEVKVCNKVLDVHVSKLRRKLTPLGVGVSFVKPNGYRLEFGDGSSSAGALPPSSGKTAAPG